MRAWLVFVGEYSISLMSSREEAKEEGTGKEKAERKGY
jgi:hypothetical protein